MPEISKSCDPFGDTLARGFLFGEAVPSSSSSRSYPLPVDGTPHFLDGYPNHGAMAYKPVHHGHEEHAKCIGMASQFVSSYAEADVFGGANSFLLPEKELKLQQQQAGSCEFSAPFGVHHSFSDPTLEVADIDADCSSWMNEVLEDISAINSDLSADSDFDLVAPVPSDFQRSIGMSASLPYLRIPNVPVSCAHSSPPAVVTAPSPPQLCSSSPTAPPSVAATSSATPSSSRSQGVSSKAPAAAEEVMSRSLTPSTLKPRRSRATKASEKKKADGEQWEHVKRERKRRDDMSYKISTLESLLPAPAALGNPKRDRATIVHDSVHHVRCLQKQVEELKSKLSDMKQRKNSEAIVSRALAREHANSKSSGEGSDGKAGKFVEYRVEIEGNCDDDGARLEKCRCRPDYMSRAMRVFEDFNLDVMRCTMTRMCLYTMCVIIAKPRASSNKAVSASAVVEALRSSITMT